MKSKDLLQQGLKESLIQAFKSEDENAVALAFTAFAEDLQESIIADAKQYQESADKVILSNRGVRQLSTDETKFYQSMITAVSSVNPKQAITDINISFPETIIDNVMADIKEAHPLLDAISFTNTTLLTKMVVNKQGAQLAVWGALDSAIVTELSGAIGKIDLTLCKLSAFMPLSKDMLAVGPAWVDAYVRATLSEAVALGTETVVVTGTGNSQPIGMDRDVSDGVVVTAGVYPKKTAVVVTEFSSTVYGSLLATLSAGPNGKTRAIDEVLLVVNPADYFNKVFPATTVRAADGTYTKNVLPFPTKVVQSSAVTVGEAVIGIAKKYFMGIGAGTSGGKVEYSDDFKFLDDERVYLTKLYGNGRALDDNAFILLDISSLVPIIQTVTVSGVVATDEVV